MDIGHRPCLRSIFRSTTSSVLLFGVAAIWTWISNYISSRSQPLQRFPICQCIAICRYRLFPSWCQRFIYQIIWWKSRRDHRVSEHVLAPLTNPKDSTIESVPSCIISSLFPSTIQCKSLAFHRIAVKQKSQRTRPTHIDKSRRTSLAPCIYSYLHCTILHISHLLHHSLVIIVMK